jgi:oligopeptide/dipeptide ABC transporter ATP-binding protein
LPPAARIDRGSIHFRNRDVLSMAEPEMQTMRGAEAAMIFQEPELVLHPLLSALRQVEEVIAAHHSHRRRARQAEALRVLGEMGLSPLASAYPHQLSGGERQRLVMAAALACEPALVIADEPTSALDSILQAQWLAWMKRLQAHRRMALLLITHDPAILAGWADRVLIVYAGTIVEQCGFEQLIRRPLHPYTQALLRSVPPGPEEVKGKSKRLPVIASISTMYASGPGCPFEARCPDRQPLCSRRAPPEVDMGDGSRVRCFQYGE